MPATKKTTGKTSMRGRTFRRVLIWCDMEGVSAVTRWEQVTSTATMYSEGRLLYTQDVNAAVRGAKRAGFAEIYVVDGHGAGGSFSFNSWLKDQLEPGARYVFGHRWGCHVDPLRRGDCVVLLIGAHARAGTEDGILCHTMSSEAWYHATLNGEPIGEVGFAAAIAGSFGAPVAFVSGDAAVCREARELLGTSLCCAVVKQGITRFSASCLAPKDAQQLIEEQVFSALSRPPSALPEPYRPNPPLELRVELMAPDQTKMYLGREGVSVVNGRTLVARDRNFFALWNKFWHY